MRKSAKQKILLIFGTRPEAIKLAPVINKLKKRASRCSVSVCVTAQHRQMLDQVLSLFEIKPDYDLGVMKPGQDLFDITTRSMNGLKTILEDVKPDVVLVQGDTTTAFVAGLSAYYLKIPVGHVEAGLRTYNKYSPFPEEANRRLLSVIADFHFAPTLWSSTNLIQEGIPSNRVWVTGNTVIDALMSVSKRQSFSRRKMELEDRFRRHRGIDLTKTGSKVILVTGHRRENFGEGFKNICSALKRIALTKKDFVIVYPVHLNPHVQKPVRSILGDMRNVKLMEPLEYEEFVFLMQRSYLVLTDSGGIQEEAPSLGKPVLVMRSVTERPEGVEAGVVKLVGTEEESIIRHTFELLDDKAKYKKMSETVNPYGDGKASERIVDILLTSLE